MSEQKPIMKWFIAFTLPPARTGLWGPVQKNVSAAPCHLPIMLPSRALLIPALFPARASSRALLKTRHPWARGMLGIVVSFRRALLARCQGRQGSRGCIPGSPVPGILQAGPGKPNLPLGLRGKAGRCARVSAGPKRPHLGTELMLLNCGAQKDSEESLGLQRDQISQS